MQRKAPEPAVQALEAVKLYELGTSVAFLPTYIRSQAYLQAKRGTEAAEFQDLVGHRRVNPTAPQHSLAKRGLGRAYVMTGDAAKARAADQDFLALWKDADPDIPVLKEAKAEHPKLQ